MYQPQYVQQKEAIVASNPVEILEEDKSMIEIIRPSIADSTELNNLSTLNDLYRLLCDFVDHSPGMLEMRMCRLPEHLEDLIDWNFYPNWQFTPDKALQQIVLARAPARTSKRILNQIGFMFTERLHMGHERFGIKIKNEPTGIAGEAFYSHRDTGGYWLRLVSYFIDEKGIVSFDKSTRERQLDLS